MSAELIRLIDAAPTVAALCIPAHAIDSLVLQLQAEGYGAGEIAARASALNERVFARLWALIAPPAVAADSCLLVMGSEGRGEQLLKTDQDNALILRDGVAFDGLEALAQRFSAALADFGYPPCPGEIMVTNPLWRRPLAAYRESIRSWVMDDDPEGPMRLAIFSDAAAVAGDAALLANARRMLQALLSDNDAYLARFAVAADQFHEPHHWLAWLGLGEEPALDVKKLGLFPLVHGVRSLAIQYRIQASGTAARLQALVEAGRLDPAFGLELLQTLDELMGLRLAWQLRERAAGRVAGNEIEPARLEPAERQRLHAALAAVKRFRAFLRLHFRLDAF